MKIINILKQASNLSRGFTMLKKVQRRFFDSRDKLSKQELKIWLETNKTSFEEMACNLDKDIWEESLNVSNQIKMNATKISKERGLDIGGGGFYPMLTFLVRLLKPEVVVETGVAAGFSSYAILHAINQNKFGKLYSSDFPYFRISNPEEFIGIVVPDELKHNWELYIESDENNLPKIISQVKNIDIFHYDSDKSYMGRKYAFNLIDLKMKPNGFRIIDDIQDNSFFYDYVIKNKIKEYFIYEFEGKYIGLIGNLKPMGEINYTKTYPN